MHLAKIFPAVAFVKRGVVGDEPDGRYAFTFQIFNGVVEQFARYAPAPMFFFRVNGADIRGEVFSVVKIVCDNAETSDDVIAVQAEITEFNPLANNGRLIGRLKINRLYTIE